ncbi:MAG: glycosyltransferase family 2 protein [Planctomycetaceae bacterium]|jgi:dolichol-phosphate mannosyltransferase|nr:glycosyltransferase family 2 protein [Planctomycetaceae bacterium]
MSTDRSSILLAIPVFNEAATIDRVLRRVQDFARDVLVVDDGSTDETPTMLARHRVEVIRHGRNRGYGRAMQEILQRAEHDGYAWVITMDCDEQHEPAQIPDFVHAIEQGDADVVSGSRYLRDDAGDDDAPAARRKVNESITAELNQRLGLGITDAFCGFKAYRVGATRNLTLSVDGYDFPLQFWVQAAANGLRVREIPVRRIYKDLNRTFGGDLDDPERRLRVYRETMHRELQRCRRRLSSAATRGLLAAISKQDAQDG